jgi:hypothetical protein
MGYLTCRLQSFLLNYQRSRKCIELHADIQYLKAMKLNLSESLNMSWFFQWTPIHDDLHLYIEERRIRNRSSWPPSEILQTWGLLSFIKLCWPYLFSNEWHREPTELVQHSAYRGSPQHSARALQVIFWSGLAMSLAYLSGKEGFFKTLFIWRLPVFAAPRGRGVRSQHPVLFTQSHIQYFRHHILQLTHPFD